jgi:hypothetical protein
MPTVHLLGAVLPLDLRVSCADIPTVHVEVEDGLTFNLMPTIVEGKIDVECSTNSMNSPDMSYICMRALDTCRAAANLVGFSTGYGLFVHLHTLIYDTGYESPIAPSQTQLSKLCTAYKVGSGGEKETETMRSLFSLVVENETLSLALNDLIEAISFPHYGAINCARALDGLRNLVAPGVSKPQGWLLTQSALNASDPYLRFISKQSEGVRHADYSQKVKVDTEESVKRMWVLMDRFLHYKRNGNQSLARPEFELL